MKETERLVRVVEKLRAEDGCPWDKAQTHESLRPFMLEETYEAIDAIGQGDTDHLYDELGDLMMIVVMLAEIGKNHGEFDIGDSLSAICDKMIQRHTHIFGSDHAASSEEVLDIWARNKMKERGQQTRTEVLREVSRSFPALMRACKLADKAERAGVGQADVQALLSDAKACLEGGIDERSLGDALLMLCAAAKRMKIDAEIALNAASDRFIDRFAALEAELASAGIALPDGKENAAKYWERVKL